MDCDKESSSLVKKFIGKDQKIDSIEDGVIYYFPENIQYCEDEESINKLISIVIRFVFKR